MFVQKAERSTIHYSYRAEYLQTNVHQHNSSSLVGVQEITCLWNWYALTAMPLLVICHSQKEVIAMFVDMAEIAVRHSFERLRRYYGESSGFSIF